MEEVVEITNIENLTHDVKCFRCAKPAGYRFHPGQATEVSINKTGWEGEKRPFTFTSLNSDPYLEFIIKIYSDHSGVTNELNALRSGDELIVRDVWGAIEYKGPGCFIAGGAGITPFVAILRQLRNENRLEGNKLFFSNKTEKDIILQAEFSAMLGTAAVYVISDGESKAYYNGHLDERFLKDFVEDFGENFYLCGPPKMVEAMQNILLRLGASPDTVVFEK